MAAEMLAKSVLKMQHAMSSQMENMKDHIQNSNDTIVQLNSMMEKMLLSNLHLSFSVLPQQIVAVIENKNPFPVEMVEYRLYNEEYQQSDREYMLAQGEIRIVMECTGDFEGTLEVQVASPGNQIPLTKQLGIRTNILDRLRFTAERGNCPIRLPCVSNLNLTNEQLRKVLKLHPFDGVVTEENGYYKAIQDKDTYYLIVSPAFNGSAQVFASPQVDYLIKN